MKVGPDIFISFHYSLKKQYRRLLCQDRKIQCGDKTFSPLLIYLLLSNHKEIRFQVKINIPLVMGRCPVWIMYRMVYQELYPELRI